MHRGHASAVSSTCHVTDTTIAITHGTTRGAHEDGVSATHMMTHNQGQRIVAPECAAHDTSCAAMVLRVHS